MILNGTKSFFLLKSKKSQHSIKKQHFHLQTKNQLKAAKLVFLQQHEWLPAKRALTAFKLSIALLLVLLGVHCSTRSELSSLRLQQSRKQSMLDSARCLREKRELPPSTAISQSVASATALFKKKNAEKRWAKIVIKIHSHSKWRLTKPIFKKV